MTNTINKIVANKCMNCGLVECLCTCDDDEWWEDECRGEYE